LLRVDQMAIDVAGMLESGLDGALRDFVKGHAADALAIAVAFLLRLGISFFLCLGRLFFLARLFAEFVGEMGGDGFAFAIRVRREVDVVGR
jgi:hypothetical protein